MTTQNSPTFWFEVFAGSTLIWALSVPSHPTFSLLVQATYCGYYDYTDYEEVWYTHSSGGYPNFDFYFIKNAYYTSAWVMPSWTSWKSGAPGFVTVLIPSNTRNVIIDQY
jgi:hypothetical protein